MYDPIEQFHKILTKFPHTALKGRELAGLLMPLIGAHPELDLLTMLPREVCEYLDQKYANFDWRALHMEITIRSVNTHLPMEEYLKQEEVGEKYRREGIRMYFRQKGVNVDVEPYSELETQGLTVFADLGICDGSIEVMTSRRNQKALIYWRNKQKSATLAWNQFFKEYTPTPDNLEQFWCRYYRTYRQILESE